MPTLAKIPCPVHGLTPCDCRLTSGGIRVTPVDGAIGPIDGTDIHPNPESTAESLKAQVSATAAATIREAVVSKKVLINKR